MSMRARACGRRALRLRTCAGPKAEAASRCQAVPPPAPPRSPHSDPDPLSFPRFLFNCRAAHWGHLLEWGPSSWRCWEALRICCGLTNREIEVRDGDRVLDSQRTSVMLWVIWSTQRQTLSYLMAKVIGKKVWQGVWIRLGQRGSPKTEEHSSF